MKNKQIAIKTTLCLVRHGETEWNVQGRIQGRDDIEMNETGRSQSKETAFFLKTERWDAIISSPLKRAAETAQIIASELSIPEIKFSELIVEREFGAASGLTFEEAKVRFPDGAPGKEPFENLCQRAMEAIQTIANEYSGKKIIVVSHGGIINSLLHILSNGEFGTSKTLLKNASISKLIFQNQTWTIDYYNKTAEELFQPLIEQKKLYSGKDIQQMRVSEEARLIGKNRVEEIKNYARLAGIKRIGIAHCIAFKNEAAKLKSALEPEFEVKSIDCYTGRVPSSVMLDNDTRGISCNPAGQAQFLANNQTELNISFGLCMGHDILFNQKSAAPVTTLVVKDREHKNNPFKEFED